MKLISKVFVDKTFGLPLVVCFNFVARVLGKFMNRDHRFENMNTIVVCKLMGLGSIIQSMPLLASLKKCFPGTKLVFVTRKSNAGLCARIPSIDRTEIIEDDSLFNLFKSLILVLTHLWGLKVDLYLNLEIYSNFSSLLTVFSIGRNRLGYYQHPQDMRAKGIYTHMIYFNRSAPISEVYLQAARATGCEYSPQHLPNLNVHPEDRDSLNQTLKAMALRLSVYEGYIVINPNASDLRLERRWPVGRFVDLILQLYRDFPSWAFLVIGGQGEEEVAQEIIAKTGLPEERLVNLVGRLSLVELIALLEGAGVMITNDSGPMHMGFSLGIPTVALFGPVSPAQYGMPWTRAVCIYKRVYCSPCVHLFFEAPCRGDNQCMKLINVTEVRTAVMQLMHDTAPRWEPDPFLYRNRDTIFGVQERTTRNDG